MLPYKEIDLIPQDLRERGRTLRRVRGWAGVFCLVLILILGLWGVEKRNHGVVARTIAELEQKNRVLEERIHQLSVLQKERDTLRKKERAVQLLLHRRSLCLVLAGISNEMNPRLWLQSFEFKDGFSPEEEPDRKGHAKGTAGGYFIIRQDALKKGKEVDRDRHRCIASFQGISLSSVDLADFLERLSKSRCYRTVDLKYVHQRHDRGLDFLEFKVETVL